MSSKHTRLDPAKMSRAERRSIIAATLYKSLTSSPSSPSSRLPWWKRYFDCFSRRRNSNQCNQVAAVDAVGVGGRSRKYKKIKNKTKRRKRN
jgi:hypothetical protein